MPVSRPRPMTYPRVTVRNDRFTQLSALATSTARPTATGRALPFAQRSRRLHMNWQLSAISGHWAARRFGHSNVSSTSTSAICPEISRAAKLRSLWDRLARGIDGFLDNRILSGCCRVVDKRSSRRNSGLIGYLFGRATPGVHVSRLCSKVRSYERDRKSLY